MQKRGQITIFLLVGVAILLLSAAFFYISAQLEKKELEVEQKEEVSFNWVKPSLQSAVEKCIKETVDPSVYLLAIQGGIIYPQEDSQLLLTDYGAVNYAWLNGNKGLSKEKMEKDLAEYLETYIDFCVGNFDTFAKQNIIVTPNYNKINAELKISPAFIDIQLKFPLKAELPNGDKLEMDTFSVRMSSSLGKLVETADGLNLPDVKPGDLLNMPYLAVIFPYDESVTIYSITDKDYPEAPLSFMFAVRNDYPANKPPTLDFIPDKTFRVGDKWEEVLFADDVNNDLLKFSSDSLAFPVAEDGTISTDLNSAGSFTVTFTVKDGRGGEDSQEVTINVLEARK
ncbi:MAG: hypothetical protein AB1668_01885 [Nanoarchaeota archaeon]